MKTDDFFEALSDIDEELIANSKPMRDPNEVVVSRAPFWRTIASCGAAAACVAVLIVGGVFGIKYINGRNAADPSASGTSAAISYTKSDCTISEPENIELINEEDFDGVILTVAKDKSSYRQGEEIKVTATVRNTTDKPIGLLMPCEGEGSHTEISTWIVRAARYLPDISIGDKVFATAMDSHIVEPGGEYVQEMTFGTFYYIRDTKKTAMPGVYKGTAGISLLAEPNDTQSETTPCSVNFELEITGDENIQPPVEKIVDNYKSGDKIPEDGLKFTMPEFPGTEFEIRNSGVFANGERLFGGITVYSVYLCDLNGDGKREIISGSRDLYKDSIYSDYVKVYNNANGKLYWFAEDPWCYDLWLDVRDDSLIAMRTCKPEYSNTRDTTAFPLTLEYLEECPAQSENAAVTKAYDYNYEKTGSWTMSEFPDIAFSCDGTFLRAERYAGIPEEPSSNMLYSGMPIMDVYLVDLNDDGKRELVSTASLGLSGIISMQVKVFDFANGKFYTLGGSPGDDYELYIDNEVLFVRTSSYVATVMPYEQPLMLDMMTESGNDVD